MQPLLLQTRSLRTLCSDSYSPSRAPSTEHGTRTRNTYTSHGTRTRHTKHATQHVLGQFLAITGVGTVTTWVLFIAHWCIGLPGKWCYV